MKQTNKTGRRRRIACARVAWMLVICTLLMLGTGCESLARRKEISAMKRIRNAYIQHLEEKYADYTEVPYGLDITKKTDLISICYSTWFTKILGPGNFPVNPPNVSEILAGNQEWAGGHAFHYWGKPALGYYRSDDKSVIRTHMTQLAEAGVDFIIIDNTNASVGWKDTGDWNLYITRPCTAILDTIVEMRGEGLKTPYVVFWSSADSSTKGWTVVDETYNEFHAQEKWKDCFVYWEGKPFMLVTDIPSVVPYGDPAHPLTVRKQWGLHSTPVTETWSFLDIYNQPIQDADGYTEQTCVCTATQETYMTEPTAHGRNHGIFMYEQWKRAFSYRPKVVTITWWNEWCAQISWDEDGNPRFVDNYNQEYSRDIEPMEGGHGDTYYQWMKAYIAAYRNMEACPRLVEEGY